MKKKQFLTLTATLLLAGLFMMACIAVSKPGLPDFSVTVTLDKTEARVGDTVTATVVFRNLRGGNIEAELPGWIAAKGGKSKEDILHVVFTPEENFDWFYYEQALICIKADVRQKFLIERGAVVEKKFEHTITVAGNLYVHAGAFFHTTLELMYSSAGQAVSYPALTITVR